LEFPNLDSGDKIMKRIDNLLSARPNQKKLSVTVRGILLFVSFTVTVLISTGMLHAQAPTDPKAYAGIWKLTAQNKRVGTLELMNYNGRLTGSLTNAHATMDKAGKLPEFDAIPGASPIVEASSSQGMLVISAESIDETIVPWNMTLTGEGKGSLQLAFKGHEMTFEITWISWEENEASPEAGK
jgi:hypothetical protein